MGDSIRKMTEWLNDYCCPMDVIYYPAIRYHMHIFVAATTDRRPDFYRKCIITGKSLSEREKRYYYRRLISLGDTIKKVSKRYRAYRSFKINIIEI
jgi:hypothetical protein